MKRNFTFGLCGAAAIAIVTATQFRPSVAQTVETTEPTAAPSTSVTPAAGAPIGAVLPGDPVPAGGAVTFTPSAAAEAVPTAATAPDASSPFAATYVNSDPAMGVYFARADHPSLQQLAAAVRGAKDDAARAAATEKMQKTLNETFDADMKRREQELAKLEERLKVLRQQMTRRQAKKGEIIELQSRVLLNEADGLGFYSSEEAVYAHPGAGVATIEGAFIAPGAAPPGFGSLERAPADPVPAATPPAADGF